MQSLIDTFKELRSSFPDKSFWDNANSSFKTSIMYNLIISYIPYDHNTTLFLMYFEAQKFVIKTDKPLLTFDIDYDKLMSIFDLIERYIEKTWILS